MKNLIFTTWASPNLNCWPRGPDYAEYCLPSIKAYAERIGADFMLFDDKYMKAIYPSATYLWFEGVKFFLESDYDRMLKLDLDILINPEAPDIFKNFADGFWLREGWEWSKMVELIKTFTNDPVDGCFSKYWSPGMVIAGKKEAKEFDALCVPPFCHPSDQVTMNYFITKMKIKPSVIPPRWHFTRAWWNDTDFKNKTGKTIQEYADITKLEDVYFMHYAGSSGTKDLISDKLWKGGN